MFVSFLIVIICFWEGFFIFLLKYFDFILFYEDVEKYFEMIGESIKSRSLGFKVNLFGFEF